MKHLSDFDLRVDGKTVAKILDDVRKHLPPKEDKDLLRRVFNLLDLTTLSEKDNILNVAHMCELVNSLDENFPGFPASQPFVSIPNWWRWSRNTWNIRW
ncbi:MAG: hypothetical protein R2751_03195 [Bacteroidales bacterium]